MPLPGGHYSQAVEANGLVFVSGILPSAAAVDALADGFDAQCISVFDQAEKMLRAAGCGFGDVVQCTAFLVGVEHWAAFNALYAGVFGQHKPARAVVPLPALHFGNLIEVQLVARKPA